MTREDAIAILNHNVSACLHGTEWGEALEMAIKALEQETRWIPISERFPEKFVYVFCSTNAGEVFITAYLGKMNDGVDCFDNDMWEGDVIAWMPLPKPYEPQESEEV